LVEAKNKYTPDDPDKPQKEVLATGTKDMDARLASPLLTDDSSLLPDDQVNINSGIDSEVGDFLDDT